MQIVAVSQNRPKPSPEPVALLPATLGQGLVAMLATLLPDSHLKSYASAVSQ